MKTAFSTVACMNMPWKDVISCAARNHMDEVEIRLSDDGRVFGISDDEIAEVAKELRINDILVSDLGTGIRTTGYHPELLPKAKRCITLARQLNARAIRVFPGSFVRRFSDPTPHDLEGMGRFLRELGKMGKDNRVEIWVETHNEFATGRDMKSLLDAANSDNVYAIWDVIHPFEQGEQPEDTLRYLDLKIAHVHIKDGIKQSDPDLIDFKYTRLGEGQLPLASIIRLLNEYGYSGTLSLEWENAWRPEIRDCYPNMDALLADWQTFLRENGVVHSEIF